MKNKTIIASKIFTLLILSMLSACSTSSAYYGAQQYQINQCLQKSPQSEYEECAKQSDKSFDEYNQERNETIKTD